MCLGVLGMLVLCGGDDAVGVEGSLSFFAA